MKQRGFTAIELSIVLSIAVILVPVAYQFVGKLDDQVALAAFELDSADAIRTVSEQLRLDARGSTSVDSGVAFTRGGCRMTWTVSEVGALVREAPGCGGTVALAAHVESIRRVDGGVDVVFARSLRPGHARRVPVFFPLVSP